MVQGEDVLSGGASTAGRLTENGLARALGRQDVSPRLLKELSPEQVARMIERQRYGRRTSKKAKKASKKRADGVVRHVRKTEAMPGKRKARSAVLSVRTAYWSRVNRELHLLICTDDKKYEKLRKYVGKESRVTQATIISSIAATIGANLGLTAAIVAPFVTLGLVAMLQIGKNAWCAGRA